MADYLQPDEETLNRFAGIARERLVREASSS